MTILGTPGDDNLTGTSGDDVFDLRQGGNDTVLGRGGNDIFTFGATFTAADSVNGGAGVDQIRLNGDYSAGVVFSATTMTSVMAIAVSGGFTYNLTTDDANLAAGSHLTVNGGNLTPGGALLFNGTDETDGRFVLTGGGQGNDILRGGSGADTFYIGVNAPGNGGTDRVEGRDGNDIINVGGALDPSDKIDGGLGNDTIIFDGDYAGAHALTLAPTTVENIATFVFDAGHSYDITTDDRTVVPGHSMAVDASSLGTSDRLTFDDSAQTSGLLVLKGGQGDDDIRGSSDGNTFDLSQGGSDIAIGGRGQDTFIMGAALNVGDILDGGSDGGIDTVVLDGTYTGTNALVLRSGTLLNIGDLLLNGDHAYNIHVIGNLTSDHSLGVELDNDPSKAVVFNASGDRSDGFYNFRGAALGHYVLTGGAGNDAFNMQNATHYALRGGHGDDSFVLGSNFTAGDFLDGGGGNDTVTMSGGALVIGTSNVFDIDKYILTDVPGAFSYHFTITDAYMPSSGTLEIAQSSTLAGDTLFVDASAVTHGTVNLTGSPGADTLIGGAGDDLLNVGQGTGDVANGGGGADLIEGQTSGVTVVYNAVSDSTGTAYDTFGDLYFGAIHIKIDALGALPTAIDPEITTGQVHKATFDSDLEAAVNASNLAAGHAVLFEAHGGAFPRTMFLIVDENGVAGYQAGQDLLIQMETGGQPLTTAVFI